MVVETTGLARRFGRRWALARLDLNVEAGERLLVLGANGSGKTTLLRVLSTLLEPSAGQFRLFGLDPSADTAAIRRRLALVSHSVGLYEDLSGLDNLRVFGGLFGRPVDPALLTEVGLELRPDPVRGYSAGMRKRLTLALMLLKSPELTLLDEPFSALDQPGMDQVGRLIREIPGTVIVASHQIARASALCDRAMVLEHGLLRWLGPASQAAEAWRAVYGGFSPADVDGPEGAQEG